MLKAQPAHNCVHLRLHTQTRRPRWCLSVPAKLFSNIYIYIDWERSASLSTSKIQHHGACCGLLEFGTTNASTDCVRECVYVFGGLDKARTAGGCAPLSCNFRARADQAISTAMAHNRWLALAAPSRKALQLTVCFAPISTFERSCDVVFVNLLFDFNCLRENVHVGFRYKRYTLSVVLYAENRSSIGPAPRFRRWPQGCANIALSDALCASPCAST